MLRPSDGVVQKIGFNHQQLLQPQQQRRMASSGSQPKQRIFHGTVTKMHDNFGFVDEDVFFPLSACDGSLPKVGDIVLVEAQFNPNMPFKWNASHVQVTQQHSPAVSQVTQLQAATHYNFPGGARPMQSSQHGRTQQHIYSQQMQTQRLPQPLGFATSGRGGAGLLGPAPVNVMNPHLSQQRQQQMSGAKGQKRNAPRSGGRDHRLSPHHQSARNRSGEREPRRRRSKTPPSQKHDRSPAHRRNFSDKSDRHPAPRYMVQFAKHLLTRKNSDVLHLRNICANLYIPSDFFSVSYKWQESFPLPQTITAERCQFYVMQKDVEPLDKLEEDILNPPDANHSWTARVMLLQLPAMKELYKQCCSLAEDGSENFLHPSRLYQFLVGYKTKKEPMALGGLWSPSLDGSDPASDPHTLIRTAIRTCKALTGIDLSKCTKWYRMLEIRYHRDAETRKGHTVPDRVETTVIFLPDVHSCMPTVTEYVTLCTRYLDKLDAYLAAEKRVAEDTKPPDTTNIKTTGDKEVPAQSSTGGSDEQTDQKMREGNGDGAKCENVEATPEKKNGAASADVSMEEDGTDQGSETAATHHSKIDIKSLRVGALRKELEARGLPSKGLKLTLVARLTEAVKKEEEEKEENDEIKGLEQSSLEQPAEEDSVRREISSTMIDEDNSLYDEQKEKKAKEGVETKKEELTGSSKTDPIENKKLEEKKDSKKLAKKKLDPERLRRHYTLPDSHPVIPVHPSTTYKKGMFECSTTSLANLLNYHQDDNKESIFEISLFAEAFRELLQRTFAFNIYKALCHPLLELKAPQEDDGKNKDGEEEHNIKPEADEEPKAKRAKGEGDDLEDEGEVADKKQEDVTEADEESEKKTDRRRSLSHDSRESKKHGKDADSKGASVKVRHSTNKPHGEKKVTVRKELLLSFSFFDQTHCGHIKESDINDIIHSIGLGLSRSQISKVTRKFIERDNLYYRKLTDVSASQVDAITEQLEKAEEIDLETLVVGNKALMPMKEVVHHRTDSETPVLKNGLAIYNGAVINVGSLQEKLRSSESNRTQLEAALETLKEKLESTNKHLTRTQKEKKSLESDYESTKKKLNDAHANFKSASDARNKYEKTLRSIAASTEAALPKSED